MIPNNARSPVELGFLTAGHVIGLVKRGKEPAQYRRTALRITRKWRAFPSNRHAAYTCRSLTVRHYRVCQYRHKSPAWRQSAWHIIHIMDDHRYCGRYDRV
jgi:hypothetical protein